MIDPVTVSAIAAMFVMAFLLALLFASGRPDGNWPMCGCGHPVFDCECSIQRVVNELVGTASIPTDEQRLIIERNLGTFDSEIFLCDQCGWWCSTDELNNLEGERHCDDCILDSERG